MKLLEGARIDLAIKIEKKDQRERNKLGQFATPALLADDIVAAAIDHLPKNTPVRFMEPGFGTGAFYSALLRKIPPAKIEKAFGVEIDDEVFADAETLWRDSKLDIVHADFTSLEVPISNENKATLLICNPPYVRHHHIMGADKLRLKREAEILGFPVSGLSGLYVYFLLLSHQWLASGAISAWLIPTEFLDVNYGQAIRDYLTSKVELISIHRFNSDDIQFAGALVSSAVVIFRNITPTSKHESAFTEGATLSNPTTKTKLTNVALRKLSKWSVSRATEAKANDTRLRIGDLFSIKRGIATGNNEFFVLSKDAIKQHGIPKEFLRPILPSARNLKTDEIFSNDLGEPSLDEYQYLLDCSLSEKEVKEFHPSLWKYLEDGKKKGVHQGYLCNSRKQWFWQEQRDPAPFICTYINRAKNGRLFRFIRNHSMATAANTYLLLYPKPPLEGAMVKDIQLTNKFWKALQSITLEDFKQAGRVYGGGLYKLEPKELANLPLPLIEGIELPPLSVR